jgi:hypothetical protein
LFVEGPILATPSLVQVTSRAIATQPVLEQSCGELPAGVSTVKPHVVGEFPTPPQVVPNLEPLVSGEEQPVAGVVEDPLVGEPVLQVSRLDPTRGVPGEDFAIAGHHGCDPVVGAGEPVCETHQKQRSIAKVEFEYAVSGV